MEICDPGRLHRPQEKRQENKPGHVRFQEKHCFLPQNKSFEDTERRTHMFIVTKINHNYYHALILRLAYKNTWE